MKLCTLRDGTRDGTLAVTDRRALRCLPATGIAPSLQAALDDWARAEPRLRELSTRLDSDPRAGQALDLGRVDAPLPRAYEWVDASAYLNHVRLVRRARGAEIPPTLESDPLVYQGGSSRMLAAHDPLVLIDPAFGLDFEAEICAVLLDTPRGTSADSADDHVALFMLANDVTYRNLVPAELAKGFGFFTSKPATAFSPLAVTKDELGSAYRHGRVHLQLKSSYNGALVGDLDAGAEMHFSFWDLIAHVTKTRAFGAGTILGSGTVSSSQRERGVSCLAERRMLEIIETGTATTPFMKLGDRIEIEMLGQDGASMFGAIRQNVVP